MREITNYLLSFMNEDFISKYNLKKPVLSKISKHFLMDIYHKIEKADSLWRSGSHIQSIDINPNTELPKGAHYDYIIKDARTTIEKSQKIGKKYVFSINSQPITVYMVYPIDKGGITPSNKDTYFWECLHRIYIWLIIAYPYKSNECSQTLNIYIYFSNAFKLLPDTKQTPFEQSHVNSAFTFACMENNEINVFREEEWFKVLIHESFHSLGLDFSKSASLSMTSKMKILSMFPVDSDVNLFETYCEINAEIMNVLFCMYFENIPLRKLEEFLLYEQVFSSFQRGKVLNHYEIACDDLYKLDSRSHKLRTRYKEKTNILSYYILKSYLITYINDFLEWMVNHNMSSLQFQETDENMNAYCQLIIGKQNSDYYLNLCSIMQDWFKKNEDNDNIETATMRMTAIEF